VEEAPRAALYKWRMFQWLLMTFLDKLGLELVSIRSGLPEADKRDDIRRLNDPSSDVDGMVTARAAGGEGINLQRCCHVLVTMEVSLLAAAGNLSSPDDSPPDPRPYQHHGPGDWASLPCQKA
jgi:hypothetical protein